MEEPGQPQPEAPTAQARPRSEAQPTVACIARTCSAQRAALRSTDCRTTTRPIERLRSVAGVGQTMPAGAVRQARSHDPQARAGRARRAEARTEQRTPGGPQQQGEIAVDTAPTDRSANALIASEHLSCGWHTIRARLIDDSTPKRRGEPEIVVALLRLDRDAGVARCRKCGGCGDGREELSRGRNADLLYSS